MSGYYDDLDLRRAGEAKYAHQAWRALANMNTEETEVERRSGQLKTARTWTCADGRTLELSAMTDDHVLNTIAFLQRRADKLALATMAVDTLGKGKLSRGVARIEKEVTRLEEQVVEFIKELGRRS